MEDMNVKIKSPIPVAQPVQAGKDSDASPTTALARAFSQAFSQFLSKGAAKANHALPLAMGHVAAVPPASRETYAPAPSERPLPARAAEPARDNRSATPAAKSADDRPAPAATHRDSANDNAGDTDQAPTTAAHDDDSPDATTANGSAGDAANAKKESAPRGDDAAKGAVAHLHAKGMAEKFIDGENPGRKVARTAKSRSDDDLAPMGVAQNVLAALAADARPVGDEEQAEAGPAENADAAAAGSHRADGIANALVRLARNQARQEQAEGGGDKQAAETDSKTRAENDKTAKSAAAATDARGRQAADLAQRVGPGEHVAVEVTVTDDAKTLVSRPASTLTAMTARGDGDKSGPSQAAGATPQANANGLMTVAASAAQAAVSQTNAPQAAALKGAAIGEIGAATATAPNSTNMPAQAQGTAPGLATTNGQAANGTAAANAAQGAQRPAASFRAEVLEQISVNIQKAVRDGTDKISIQLRPAELGRVDVRIEVGGDGRAQVHVTADRADTLDLLQRDSRELTRALQDAGLRADAGSLQFGLREQTADQRQGRGRANGGARGVDAANAEAGIADALPAWTPTVQPGRLDIRA